MFGKIKKLLLLVQSLAIEIETLKYDVAQLKKKPSKPAVKKTSK